MNNRTSLLRGLALGGAAIALVLATLYLGVMHTAAGQDFLLSRVAAAAVAPRGSRQCGPSGIELTRSTGVGMTALYHLVPGPRKALMENIFRRDFTNNMLLTRDLMWFELPVGGNEIRIDPS